MQNLIFHISLPKGIKLMNGATLMKDVTFDFISQITPYYSTIDMVRLAAGPTLKKLSDITIACQIYRSSNEADLITAARVPLSGLQHTRLIGSRLQYVTALASRDLMLNVVSLLAPALMYWQTSPSIARRTISSVWLSSRNLSNSTRWFSAAAVG